MSELLKKERQAEVLDMIIDHASNTSKIIVCSTPKARKLVNRRIAEKNLNKTGYLRKPIVMLQNQYEKIYGKKCEATNLLTHMRH